MTHIAHRRNAELVSYFDCLQMPPKKEKKKKRKKSGKVDQVEEKYKQTLQKINSLQDELVYRTDIARRSQATSSDLREKIKEANENTENERIDKYDITCDLKRQYKTIHLELTTKIKLLEGSNKALTEKLSVVEQKLKDEQSEKDKIVKEKDEIIYDLEYKIENMEAAYENILHDAFDEMGKRLDKARAAWKIEALDIQQKNKELLLSFGLNPLDI